MRGSPLCQEPVAERKADLNDVRKKAPNCHRKADLLSPSPDRSQDAPKEDDHHGLRELGRAQEIQQRLVEAGLWAGRLGESFVSLVESTVDRRHLPGPLKIPLLWKAQESHPKPGCPELPHTPPGKPSGPGSYDLIIIFFAKITSLQQ